jgi:hypothetical protein
LLNKTSNLLPGENKSSTVENVDELAEWSERRERYRLTPQERFAESMKLWETYLAWGGSLEPEPDTESPFFDPQEWRENARNVRSGVRGQSSKTEARKRIFNRGRPYQVPGAEYMHSAFLRGRSHPPVEGLEGYALLFGQRRERSVIGCQPKTDCEFRSTPNHGQHFGRLNLDL